MSETVHTLKDFNLQCALALHPWTLRVEWNDLNAPTARLLKTTKQMRSCPKCGKIQTRTV